MRLKINLKGKVTLDHCNQHYITRFIHSAIGCNNDMHDTFSDYAISTLQGGRLTREGIEYCDPYFVISSPSPDIINRFFISLLPKVNDTIDYIGLTVGSIECQALDVSRSYDKIQTMCPIRLKINDKEAMVGDELWLKELIERSKKKLLHFKPDINLRGFDIKIHQFERCKRKTVSVKQGVITKCSQVRLIVNGSKEARLALYDMGIGQSCGCGFGSVKVI